MIRVSNPKETKMAIRISSINDAVLDNSPVDRMPFSCTVTQMVPLPCSSTDSTVYTLTLEGHEDELLREHSDNNNDNNNNNNNSNNDHNNTWSHTTLDHTAIVTIPFEKHSIEIGGKDNSSIFQYSLNIIFKDEGGNGPDNSVNVLIAFTL